MATSRTWTTPWSANIAGCVPGLGEEVGVVAQDLERRLRLDRPPEAILEIVPDGRA